MVSIADARNARLRPSYEITHRPWRQTVSRIFNICLLIVNHTISESHVLKNILNHLKRIPCDQIKVNFINAWQMIEHELNILYSVV